MSRENWLSGSNAAIKVLIRLHSAIETFFVHIQNYCFLSNISVLRKPAFVRLCNLAYCIFTGLDLYCFLRQKNRFLHIHVLSTESVSAVN